MNHITQAHLEYFSSVLGDDNVVTELASLDKISKDFYWYSPVLKRQLDDKRAEVALRIDALDKLKAIVSFCSKERIPVMLRGGGTGNYGQLIPLYGGVMLDLAGLDKIYDLDGVVRCEPGTRLGTIETKARELGWELRCMPSTWVKSSMAGFICGGSGGIGSITYGGINYGDNMKSVTLLTVEEEPRLIKLEERDCIKALHTYGTTGIVVEIEMRLGKAMPWEQLVFVHDDWTTLLNWTNDIAAESSISKRLVTQFESPIPHYFKPLKKALPEGKHATFLMIHEGQVDEVVASGAKLGIEKTYQKDFPTPPKPPYIMDYTWNHTTLWALKADPTITYLQCGFGENFPKKFDLLKAKFGDEILFHLEWTLSNSKMGKSEDTISCGGIPLVHFKTEERLQEMIDYCEEIGVFVANPHTCYLEEGGAHPDIVEKRALKDNVDPFAICNPGKMKTYDKNPFAEPVSA